jgi:outer membrane protein assembly factor BamA
VRPPAPIAVTPGAPVAATRVRVVGGLWIEELTVKRVHRGEPMSGELARRAMDELLSTGKVADVRAFVEKTDEGLVLVLEVVPRRLVASVSVEGSPIGPEVVEGALGLRENAEVTAFSLRRAAEAAERVLGEGGYPEARVFIAPEETDDPLRVRLAVRVEAGPERTIVKRDFEITPAPAHPELLEALSGYAVKVGERQDVARLHEADEAMQAALRERGFYDASVTYRLRGPGDVVVRVQAGPKYGIRFEGNRTFDQERLSAALDLGLREDHSPDVLAGAIRRFYVERGFLDAEVVAERHGGERAQSSELVLRVRERQRVRVVKRVYPCLGGAKTAAEVGSEIDGVLGEELPGLGIIEGVNPNAMDQMLGPSPSAASQVELFRASPWTTFAPSAYENATQHLEEVFHAQGYVDVRVGPITVVRRRCDPRSQPNVCIPLGERKLPETSCVLNEDALALGADKTLETCRPDSKRGIRCEPEAVLVIPVRPGRQAILFDAEFEGNQALTEAELLEDAQLELGKPVSTAGIEAARRRILDRYAEDAYAFAEVTAELELSPDHTRAHVRFSISEREPVHVSRIVVVGATRTRESLIRKRMALSPGDLYRRSAATRTQEQIETLGTFTSVSVGLEDPGIPAREKVVVVTVGERMPQYVDVRGGFATGDGFRVGFEYGHRNIGGDAILFTARAQLGLRPTAFIFEDDVRRKYEEAELSWEELLERRNSVTLSFPDIGLGPLFRLSFEALDVRDNQRDFALSKDALFVRLTYRPSRGFWIQPGASIELNDANIFGTEDVSFDDPNLSETDRERLVRENQQFFTLVRVPEGQSYAFGQSISAGWDRRDNSLDATSGTFVTGGVEHVTARPVSADRPCNELLTDDQIDTDPTQIFSATCSELLRFTNRIAGYLPLNNKKLSVAASFQWGYILQLTDYSRTYPDRLFFMGGVETIRGYLQDSLVPQDIADLLLEPNTELNINQVPLRGGNVFLNPRLELRIPLSDSVATALFVDAGNLWSDPALMDPTQLRYAVGSGLRIATPVGPLVFDYGFNVERVIDAFDPGEEGERYWEDIGAFHFSIGLF